MVIKCTFYCCTFYCSTVA